MKKIIGILFVCMLLISTAGLSIGNSVKIELNNINDSNQTPQYFVPGEIVIKFRENTPLVISHSGTIITTGIPSIDILNKEYKVTDIKGTFTSVITKPKNPELFKSVGLDRIYTFKVDESTNIFDAINAYRKDPYVEEADVSGVGYGCVIPNDPNFGKQWGFHNTGQSSGTPDADIDAPEGWDIQKGNTNVIVAIIDSGIDYNHQDLSTKIWTNTDEDIDGFDDDSNGFIDDIRGWNFCGENNNPMDDHTYSHGTFCAGIAGANTNNNLGVAGMLWSCQLMAVKAMYGNNVIYWSDAGPAIVYAADNGADVISMSFSGSSDNTTLKSACDYAYAAGCVLVAAIGNHGTSAPYIPAKYDCVIAVGATDRNDTRWPSSAYGSHIGVVAPGVEIYSTMKNNQYGYNTGTSFSTPMVAGLAGLLIAKNPTYANYQIRALINVMAEDQVGNPSEDTPGFDYYYGNGRINAYRSLYNAPVKPTKPVGPPSGKKGTQYTYSTVSYDLEEHNLYYWWDWGDGSNSGWLGPYTHGQQTSASHIWNTDGTYLIKVKSKDMLGKESDWSDPLSVTMPRNRILNSLLLKFAQNNNIKILSLLRYLFSQNLLK